MASRSEAVPTARSDDIDVSMPGIASASEGYVAFPMLVDALRDAELAKEYVWCKDFTMHSRQNVFRIAVGTAE